MTILFSIHYFLWYGALASIFGYEGVFAHHYTNSTTMQFGYIKMVLPFATVIVTPIFCSLADRRRAHRVYFISALTVAMLAVTSMALMALIITPHYDPSHLRIGPWIWYCISTTAYGLSIGVTTCLSDSFAVLQAEESGTSFGRIIVMGTIGWASVALTLSFVNRIRNFPRLLPGLMLGVILLSIDVLVVSFWTRKKDFLLDTIPIDAAQTVTGSSSTSHIDPSDYLPQNESAKVNLGTEVSDNNGALRCRTDSSVRIAIAMNQNRNKPLVPQLVKEPSNLQPTEGKSPSVSASVKTIDSELDSEQSVDVSSKVSERQETNEVPSYHLQSSVKLTEFKASEDLAEGAGKSEIQATSFKIQLLLLFYIMRRRKTLIRYLILFILSGFFMSMHWSYFFLYLENINGKNFELISALSMIGQSILGELPFFVLSRQLINYFGRSHTLSISVMTIGLRFLLYAFLLPNVTMYLVFLADCLQGPNYGLFYVVMTEVGLEYSYCDDETIEKLARRGDCDRNNKLQVDSLRLSLRSTVQSVAFACYEGVGVGLGSLTGGWIVSRYGYEALWLSMAIASFVVGVINIVIEVSCREADPETDLSDRREFIEARRKGVLRKIASPRPMPAITQVPLQMQDSLVSKLRRLTNRSQLNNSEIDKNITKAVGV